MASSENVAQEPNTVDESQKPNPSSVPPEPEESPQDEQHGKDREKAGTSSLEREERNSEKGGDNAQRSSSGEDKKNTESSCGSFKDTREGSEGSNPQRDRDSESDSRTGLKSPLSGSSSQSPEEILKEVAASSPDDSLFGSPGPSSLMPPDPPTKERDGVDDPGPILHLNILLTSGTKHPFRINGKYMKDRDLVVDNDDPYNLSVYTLKELIWKEWRDDWEDRPASPGSIRLISFGKMLEDKSSLSECRFNREAPNVVHMTVRPQEVVEDEDSKAAKTKSAQNQDNDEGEGHSICRCTIL